LGNLVFNAEMAPAWGRVDESNLEVTLHDEPEPADVDLVDRLVVFAINSGAEINPVSSDVDDRQLVAIQRF
jgi:hypothetical protein